MAKNIAQAFGKALLAGAKARRSPLGRSPLASPGAKKDTAAIAKAARTAPKAKASATELPLQQMAPLPSKKRKTSNPSGIIGTKNPVDYY